MPIFNTEYKSRPNATAIELNRSSISLNTVWQTAQLTAILTPSDAGNSITWSSSDTTIATVSQSWLVTCVTPWTATITATTDNWLTATCSVWQWWTPWANTLVYIPLTQAEGTNVYGTLWLTLTIIWGTFTDNYYYTASGSDYMYTWPSTYSTYSSYTLMCWVKYINWGWFWWNNYWDWDNGNIFVFNGNVERYSGSIMNISFTSLDNKWHHLALVGASWILYIDWSQAGTNSNALNFKPRLLGINTQRMSWLSWCEACYSDYIFEDKVRTATEILDYYNLTKGNYWIS